MAKDTKYQMHVVSHTHWDREWRLTFQEFRMKLVDCIDNLLAIMDKEPGFKHYTLDGQSSVIDDYLAIRPENRQKIIEYTKQGRLLLGPWYTLVDESLLHGESLVRNIKLGHEISQSLGGTMKIGYGISSFGHIAQFPQLWSGFEIDNVIFSRGISDWQTNSEFIWESPDGTQALALHLPDNYTKSNWFYVVYRPAMYGMAADDWKYPFGEIGLPFHACDEASANNMFRLLDPKLKYDPDHTFKCIMQLRDECAAIATTEHLLFMDGVDHLEPNPLLPQILEDAAKRLDGTGETITHSTLPVYVDKLRQALKDKGVNLEVITGEMRRPTKQGVHNALMGQVMSSRIYLKLQNQQCQTTLAKWAEPMASAATLLGFPYPKPYFDMAWKYMMQNHAHDCICGCSIDPVHDTMEHRFKQAQIIGDELTQRAFWQIVPEIDRSSLGEQELAVTVFNSLPFERSDVMTFALDLPKEWKSQSLAVYDLDGKEIPNQVFWQEKIISEILQPLNAQLGIHAQRYMAHVPVSNVPGVGYTTLIVKPLPKSCKRQLGSMVPVTNTMENAHLRVKINDNGTFDITDKTTGRSYPGQHVLEDGGDMGNPWLYIPPAEDQVITSPGCPVKVALVADGPVLARYRITYKLEVPMKMTLERTRELAEDAESRFSKRTDETVQMVVESEVTLARDSKRVDVVTRLTNNARDHRLRVLFPSGIADATESAAEAQFDVYNRPIKLPDTTGWKEQAYAEHPQLGFVDVSDGKVGLAIINDGIPEYSVIDDEDRTIALTLFRATARAIGEDFFQEGAQTLRPLIFGYSIYPHAGAWDKAKVFEQSLTHNTPMKATLSSRYSKGSLPQKASFLTISPSSIVMSALKKADKGDGLILRMYNPTSNDTKAEVKCDVRPVKKARLVNFLEEPKGDLAVGAGGVVSIEMPHKKIVTIELGF
ncbi:MAG: glycoside hydrolase family 38 C-terminal domain-containing protein [Armatimonadota bacterium]|nr:glycoside hydrolase family 38 C-terminal domain-containing protein [Armatimonadota bacterium]